MKKIMKINKSNIKEKNTCKTVDVAIDYSAYISNGYCYRILSISKIESGKRNILLALPIGPQDKGTDVLSKLLRFAIKRNKINLVNADRYFFSSDALQVFQKFHLKYLIPCQPNPKIRKILDSMPAPFVVEDYQLKDTNCNLIILQCKGKKGNTIKRAYATNLEIDAKDTDSIEKIFSFNSTHWETNVLSESVRTSKMTTNNLKFLHSTF